MRQTLPQTDDELCSIVRSGETWPIGELWERHSAAALAWAHKKDPGHGEDAVADAFDAVFQALLAGGGPDTSFRGYLFRTVHTQLMKRWETQHRNTSLDEFDFELPDTNATSSIDGLSAGEQSAAARSAFAGLPHRWQQIIEEVDVNGSRVKDVAETLGLTQNAAAVLLKRAREGLRKAWLGHMHPTRELDESCADAVSLFSELRWGRRNGLQRKEAEAHVDGCKNCAGRWQQFIGQASLVGLTTAGMIGLVQSWSRRIAKPRLATAAGISLALAIGASVGTALNSPADLPIAPIPTAPIEQPTPPPVTLPEAEEANDQAPVESDAVPVDPPHPAPQLTEAPAKPLPEPPAPITPPTSQPSSPPDDLLYGDWSGWCEATQEFLDDGSCPA